MESNAMNDNTVDHIEEVHRHEVSDEAVEAVSTRIEIAGV
jgi:hypothetical protein